MISITVSLQLAKKLEKLRDARITEKRKDMRNNQVVLYHDKLGERIFNLFILHSRKRDQNYLQIGNEMYHSLQVIPINSLSLIVSINNECGASFIRTSVNWLYTYKLHQKLY